MKNIIYKSSVFIFITLFLALSAVEAMGAAKPLQVCVSKTGLITAKLKCKKKETRLSKINFSSAIGATGPQGPTGPTGPQGSTGAAGSFSLRKFYISKVPVQGGGASSSCSSGYHMASMWELWNPSFLEYNSTLGETASDAGSGAPNSYTGWVRTGNFSSSVDPAGTANCSAYTSNSGSAKGTVITLRTNWTTSNTVGAWDAASIACNLAARVWCVED